MLLKIFKNYITTEEILNIGKKITFNFVFSIEDKKNANFLKNINKKIEDILIVSIRRERLKTQPLQHYLGHSNNKNEYQHILHSLYMLKI